MSKDKNTYEIPELGQLKIENVILKMGNLQERATRINEQFGSLGKIRNDIITKVREEVGAPEDYLVSEDLKNFVPPPPTPNDPDPKGTSDDDNPEEKSNGKG